MNTISSFFSISIPATPHYNWAFLDMQNVYQGAAEQGFRIHWPSLRRYLYEEYNVVKAIAFLGYLPKYQFIYNELRAAGFELQFKQVKWVDNGRLSGNVDADLITYALEYKGEYGKAVFVADDSDYLRMIESLYRQNKLEAIISSHPLATTSTLIKEAVDPRMMSSIHTIKQHIALNTMQ